MAKAGLLEAAAAEITAGEVHLDAIDVLEVQAQKAPLSQGQGLPTPLGKWAGRTSEGRHQGIELLAAACPQQLSGAIEQLEHATVADVVDEAAFWPAQHHPRNRE